MAKLQRWMPVNQKLAWRAWCECAHTRWQTRMCTRADGQTWMGAREQPCPHMELSCQLMRAQSSLVLTYPTIFLDIQDGEKKDLKDNNCNSKLEDSLLRSGSYIQPQRSS